MKKRETIKAGTALVIFLVSVLAMDSDYYIVAGIVALVSLLYFGLCGRRAYGTN